MTVGLPFARTINIPLTISAITFGISPSNPDNTAAFQRAIDALSAQGGGCIHLTAPGTYVMGSPDPANNWIMVELASNIEIKACPGAVIQAADGLNTATDTFRMFGHNGLADLVNVRFTDVVFDLNGTNNLVPASDPVKPNQAIYILRGERLFVTGCAFLNNAGRQSVHFGNNTAPQSCRNVEIVRNTFDTFGTAVPGNVEQTDHSAIYCQALGATIRGNYFNNDTLAAEATAIESHNSRSVIDDNTIYNCGAGVNVVATVSDQEDTVYASNIIENTQRGFHVYCFTGFTMQRVQIRDNVVRQASTALTHCLDLNSNVQANSVCTDIRIEGNTIVGAFTDFDGELHGITVGRLGRIWIRGNKLMNLTGSAVNTGDLVDEQLDIVIKDNECVNVGVTDETNSRSALRLDSLVTIKRARISRNSVFSTVVSDATTTNGSPTLTAVSDIAAWEVGMPIHGPGIPGNTVVQSINVGASEITMDQNASASATVTVFAGADTGILSNADILYATIEGNDFDRDTIGASGVPVELTGTVSNIRQQTYDPGAAPAASPSAYVFGSDRESSSLVIDNATGGISQFGIAFAGVLSHWLLWTTSQLQIATAGQARLAIDNDQFNPVTHNAMTNGLFGTRWLKTFTNGIAVRFGTATAPNNDDCYIQNNNGTVTLPLAASNTGEGTIYIVENIGGSTTIARTGSDTINGAAANQTL
jgi:hypothetical protein